MTLKDNILEVINARGPQTDADLAKWCKAKLPSVRRTRNDLVKAGQLFLQPPSARGNVYGTKSVTVGAVVAKVITAKPSKKAAQPENAPTMFELVPPKKEKETEKPDMSNWCMTDFTF